jgi:hypothetical protein
MLTNYVLNAIKSSLLLDMQTNISHIAVGSGTTTPTTSDTALVTETDRDALFTESVTGSVYTCSMYLDTTEANSTNIAETGLFNASSSGIMYLRALTNVIAKTSAVETFIEINVLIAAVNG